MTTIYEQSIGLSPLLSRILACVTFTEYFIMNLLAIFFIERLGRRPLLMMGAAGQAIAMAALAGLTDNLTSARGIAATVFIFIYLSCFGMSWGPVVW